MRASQCDDLFGDHEQMGLNVTPYQHLHVLGLQWNSLYYLVDLQTGHLFEGLGIKLFILGLS